MDFDLDEADMEHWSDDEIAEFLDDSGISMPPEAFRKLAQFARKQGGLENALMLLQAAMRDAA